MGKELELIEYQLDKIDINYFLSELMEAIKYLAVYETKISDCRIEDGIFLPRLQQKEALSSLKIEGTQTTMNDIIADEIVPNEKNADLIEIKNHSTAIMKASEAVKFSGFSNDLIKEIHKTLLTKVRKKNKGIILGEYKRKDNFIVNSVGTKIFTPPSYTETNKYMDDLLKFMNDKTSSLHPLIRSAIVHAQFESIHPFEDGNGRVGRLLITVFLYYHQVINAPLFYISEALQEDKISYYNYLTKSRDGHYNEWIKYFLSKCTVQAKKHINYIDSINHLYSETDKIVSKIIKTNSKNVLKVLFDYPLLTAKVLSKEIDISMQQAKRYLKLLENEKILIADDKQRNTTYYFIELINLIL